MSGFAARLEIRLRRAGRPWELALFGALPLALIGLILAEDAGAHRSLGDWAIFRTAALAVLHGHSPYGSVAHAALARNDEFVYTPATAVLLVPLAVLPAELGRVLVLLLGIACVLWALRLLGVRDWRCYGLSILTAPVLDSTSLGALSTLVLLVVAAAWRLRDRTPSGPLAASIAAVWKLVLWPLGIWLLATRRLRAAALAAVAAAVLVLGSWAAIGFAGLRGYGHLVRALSRVEAGESYSLAGLVGSSGLVTVLLVAAVVGAVVAAARSDDGDRRAFAVAVAGALLATPVLWLHYFVLLFVPLALYRPRLSAVWFVPLAFWVTPFPHSDGSDWRTVVALGIAAVTVAGALYGRASTVTPLRATIVRMIPARRSAVSTADSSAR